MSVDNYCPICNSVWNIKVGKLQDCSKAILEHSKSEHESVCPDCRTMNAQFNQFLEYVDSLYGHIDNTIYRNILMRICELKKVVKCID